MKFLINPNERLLAQYGASIADTKNLYLIVVDDCRLILTNQWQKDHVVNLGYSEPTESDNYVVHHLGVRFLDNCFEELPIFIQHKSTIIQHAEEYYQVRFKSVFKRGET